MTRSHFLRSRLIAAPPPLPWALVQGAAFVAVPTFIRLAVDPVVAGAAHATYYPFVLFAALLVGWRAAAFVIVASAVIANFLFIEPRHVLFATLNDTLSTAFFVFSGSLITAVVDTLRRAVIDLELSAERVNALNAEAKHLNAELQHRVKNSLAVVQALALHTFRGLSSGDDAVRKFQGRLQALAEAQAILTTGKWEHCLLPDLALRAVAPFNGHGAIHCDGPATCLPEPACVPLVLALHELGTNAIKYGALSSLEGSVAISWSLVPAEGEEPAKLVLEWREHGGPSVQAPQRRGLGSRLIASQPGIDAATLDFQPDGVVCRIEVRGAVAHPDG